MATTEANNEPLHTGTLGFPRKAYALVTVSDLRMPDGANGYDTPCLLDIAWETVRLSAEQCEGDREFIDEPYLLVEMEFTMREVKRVPGDTLIRGEPAYVEWFCNRGKECEEESDAQPTLF